MPPSQLKRLKASLREQGIVGPQKSKKQKKQNAQSGTIDQTRAHRTVALHGIREQFNPYEFKTSARGPKFEVTTSRTIGGRISKNVKARPGVTKGLGEQTRRKTLLVEMQRRNKVGGVLDRRFGENDPTMTLEEKMLERFTQEKQRRHKSSSAFDLEDGEEGELTHLGQSLSLDGPGLADDFDNEGLTLSDADDHSSVNEESSYKRRRDSQEGDLNHEDEKFEGQPERKKTKQEVMKEVVAKSKLYKYERQAAKDEDEDMREELDKDLPEIHALLRGTALRPTPKPVDVHGMNPDRAALLKENEKSRFDKEYDLRLRQLAQDKKSKPTERTKSEEEKLADQARILQELEAARLRRMQGEPEEGEEEEAEPAKNLIDVQEEEDDEFGFGSGIQTQISRTQVDVEDEDDFVIEENLVANSSDISISDKSFSSEDGGDEVAFDEDEFVEGLLTEEEAKRPEFLTGANGPLPEIQISGKYATNGNLAYTYPCPLSHAELLEITNRVAMKDLPTVVRRIRALYHPQLKSENKSKLGKFAVALVDHVSYLANQSAFPPFEILETLVRHIHSLSRTFPVEVSNAFLTHLRNQNDLRAFELSPGDLALLVAIGTIFPTSDHFHQVVTPAILCMARYIAQKIPHTLSEYVMGTFIITICLQFQRLSKRYIPEVTGFLLNTLCALAPSRPLQILGNFVCHESRLLRLEGAHDVRVRRLKFRDISNQELDSEETTAVMAALIETSIKLIDAAAEIWIGKSSFEEVFEPALKVLQHFGSKSCYEGLPATIQTSVTKSCHKLERLLKHAHRARRPLELHHHRPLAIKTSIPKFEESFNPDRHYDPDRERAEASKLRAEHKRELKGARRELRKDSQFIARETLREKRENDAAYEKKYKRLVAEIQGEEGREAKAYERERQGRKRGRT